MSTVKLYLGDCTLEQAREACRKWHYSGTCPEAARARIGVWEGCRFIGCVIFTNGPRSSGYERYDVSKAQVCALARVALREHQTPVSRIVSIAIKLLRRRIPELKLIVSYADPAEGHAGIIYQAGHWIYCGETSPSRIYRSRSGRLWHSRSVAENEHGFTWMGGQWRKVPKARWMKRIWKPGKHRYVMPLDSNLRAILEAIAIPYPKRATEALTAMRSATQRIEGGASPTRSLHSKRRIAEAKQTPGLILGV